MDSRSRTWLVGVAGLAVVLAGCPHEDIVGVELPVAMDAGQHAGAAGAAGAAGSAAASICNPQAAIELLPFAFVVGQLGGPTSCDVPATAVNQQTLIAFAAIRGRPTAEDHQQTPCDMDPSGKPYYVNLRNTNLDTICEPYCTDLKNYVHTVSGEFLACRPDAGVRP
jgi:hypothetical protein